MPRHQRKPRLAQLIITGGGVKAKHAPWADFLITMDRGEAFITLIIKAEDDGYFPQVIGLLIADPAIGAGDVKQQPHQFFQHRRCGREQPRNLAGIAFKPVGCPACHLPDAADGIDVFSGDIDLFPEGENFAPGHDPVCLGHFGGKRDQRDRKGSLAFGLLVMGITGGVDIISMPDQRTNQRAHRPAQRETRCPADDFSPDAHAHLIKGG